MFYNKPFHVCNIITSNNNNMVPIILSHDVDIDILLVNNYI